MSEKPWRERYRDRIGTAAEAMKLVKPGNRIFIGTGCGQPQHLVNALVEHSSHLADTQILHLLTMGVAPYAHPRFVGRFKTNSFFIAENVREVMNTGLGDYTPIFLSEIPDEFTSGRIPLDVALIQVTEPDINGLCSLGVSVDIVKAAAASAKYVIAQANPQMPRTFGDAAIHINDIDVVVPFEEPIIETDVPEPDDTIRSIARNVARLVEDGSTLEFGIGQVPQAVAEYLRDKRDLGIHTEMFSDWLMTLVESGAVTGKKKTINRGKIVASFCMGSRRLYDFVNGNSFIEFHPSEYVNDPFVISRHDRMVAVNVGLEVDLSGQVVADSLGYRFYSGIGGQVDFNRGAARSRDGKAIIALPSTAKEGTVSRIVPHLTEGSGVVTTRGDVHYVVTEHGVAYLHGRSLRERVLSLIQIAHPAFRRELMQAAKRQGYLNEDQVELPWEKVEYPEELERYEALSDGTEIFFRPVRPTDEPALADMLYSLSRQSVQLRFFTHTKTFPHRELQHLVSVDYDNELAIVGVVPGPGTEEIVALAQYFRDPKTHRAEVAFVVHDEWQKKGMGTFLLRYLTSIARKRGIRSFHAKVLPANRSMLTIFHNSGYAVKTEFDGETYSISYDLPDGEEPR